jgi:hypothetical protein
MFIVRIVITIPSAPEEQPLRVAVCSSSGASEEDASHIYKHCAPPERDALIRE